MPVCCCYSRLEDFNCIFFVFYVCSIYCAHCWHFNCASYQTAYRCISWRQLTLVLENKYCESLKTYDSFLQTCNVVFNRYQMMTYVNVRSLSVSRVYGSCFELLFLLLFCLPQFCFQLITIILSHYPSTPVCFGLYCT